MLLDDFKYVKMKKMEGGESAHISVGYSLMCIFFALLTLAIAVVGIIGVVRISTDDSRKISKKEIGIEVTVFNKLDDEVLVVSIQDEEINEKVSGGLIESFTYIPSKAGVPLSVHLYIRGKDYDVEILEIILRSVKGEVMLYVENTYDRKISFSTVSYY